jgi:hypothetical protein
LHPNQSLFSGNLGGENNLLLCSLYIHSNLLSNSPREIS